MANLTLMALGSSAPEILLNIIETLSTLGKTPGELGPSTIVGSAAFNLLVISAVSVMAVKTGTVKKIDDLGVFAITACSSLFAYIWMYLVLNVFSPNRVDLWEALVTLLFMVFLLSFAFIADKINYFIKKKKKQDAGNNEPDDIQKLFHADDFLRILKAEGNNEKLSKEDEVKKKHIKKYLKDTFNTENFSEVDPHKLKEAMTPQSVISRMQYRRQVGNQLSGRKDLIVVKGMKYMNEEAYAKELKSSELNKNCGFPCLHYSVSEGAGTLKVEVVKKCSGSLRVGVKTVDDTANAGEDYKEIEEILEFSSSETTKIVEIGIIDDNEWEPDEDFLIELYDPDT